MAPIISTMPVAASTKAAADQMSSSVLYRGVSSASRCSTCSAKAMPQTSAPAMTKTALWSMHAWAKDFRERYPKLGEAMRALTTTEDTPSATSFETYLRGELGTYSDQTFERYEAMIGERAAASPQRNITEETLLHTVQLGGFDTLEEAEASQA